MQQLKKLYRSNYAGENIVSNLILCDGEWNPTTEFVPNRVINTHTTTQAVAIGNGESRQNFDLRLIGGNRAGILGTDRLQSYGCNALYRDFTPDFLIATGDKIIEEIANSGYTANNIVYTSAGPILNYPGKFYLTPQNLSYDAGSLATYMACFDGHKKVFLIGFDQYDNHHQADDGVYNNIYKNTNGYLNDAESQNAQFFTLALRNVMIAYSDVEFVRVMPLATHWVPDEVLPLPNFRQIDYNEFRTEADLGLMVA